MTRPLISVIIPAYNHASFIAEAICSVTGQGYPSLELVVVDDGSSDGTADRAEETLREKKIPFRIRRQPNQGAHAAINTGINLSNGKWISILNSDDRYVPGRLHRLIQTTAHTDSRFLITRVRHIDAYGNELPKDSKYRIYYNDSLNTISKYPVPGFELLRHNYALTTGNFFFQRSLFDQVGPFHSYRICHDWDFILRTLLVEDIHFLLDEDLYEYRVHSSNTMGTTSPDLRWKEVDEVLSKYILHAEEATNPRAPCKKNFPNYWENFLANEFPYLLNFPLTSQALSRYGLDQTTSSRKATWLRKIRNTIRNQINRSMRK